eukprot:3352633-Pleurochrysis_carterae.AAC.1
MTPSGKCARASHNVCMEQLSLSLGFREECEFVPVLRGERQPMCSADAGARARQQSSQDSESVRRWRHRCARLEHMRMYNH